VGNDKNDYVTDLYIYYIFTIILEYTPTYKNRLTVKHPQAGPSRGTLMECQEKALLPWVTLLCAISPKHLPLGRKVEVEFSNINEPDLV
jgi:hypothetical protein